MPRCLIVLLFATLPVLATPSRAATPEIPAQTFTLDPGHSSVWFSVNHLGLSDFTASFDRVSARLELDPQNPGAAKLQVEIDVRSLDLPAPQTGFFDELMQAPWFQADAHPVMTYVSEQITLTGETEARVDGILTLNGTSAPVPLRVRFNTGYPAKIIEPHARLGFSAEGQLDRSSFGMNFGIPPEGSTFGVGDTVTVRIEAEFIGEPGPD